MACGPASRNDRSCGVYSCGCTRTFLCQDGQRRRTGPWVTSEGIYPAHVDMRFTCAHAVYMSRMVQVRNVPDALHRKLKARAADAGQTLSDYLLAELERLATRPTRDEMLAKLHSRRRVTLKTPAAHVIRDERESA